jgi:hypothetical protein
MKRTFVALMLIACAAAWVMAPNPSRAEGALAMGYSGNVTKDGIAVGTAWNEPNKERARALALKRCQDYKPAPKMAARCKVITTFSRSCAATAFDPKFGTPGAGVALGPDKDSAEAMALAMCEVTAGPGRLTACIVMKGSGAISSTVASSVDGTVCDSRE